MAQSRSEVYRQILTEPLHLSDRDITQAFDAARLDPRLMEIMTEFVRDFWWTREPRSLNQAAKKAKFPFMLGAATSVILDECEMAPNDRTDYIDWMRLAIRGLKKPAPQLLYIGVIPIGSRMMQDEIEGAQPAFLKHGLISKDLPFNKENPGTLRSERHPPENRIDDLDLLKLRLVQQLKAMKTVQHLTNEEVARQTGINRVFLSKIMNNKFDGITADYLMKKCALLKKHA